MDVDDSSAEAPPAAAASAALRRQFETEVWDANAALARRQLLDSSEFGAFVRDLLAVGEVDLDEAVEDEHDEVTSRRESGATFSPATYCRTPSRSM